MVNWKFAGLAGLRSVFIGEDNHMNVLVINAGSSSLKYQLLDVDTREVYAKGNCERIGIEGSFIGHEEMGGEKQKLE